MSVPPQSCFGVTLVHLDLNSEAETLFSWEQCRWIHQKQLGCTAQLYDGGCVFRLLSSSNFSRTPNTCCGVIALGRFAQMFQLWHVFLCIAELWIWGYAQPWSRRRSSYCRAGPVASPWEPGASSIRLQEAAPSALPGGTVSMTCSPSPHEMNPMTIT